jgi:hypothetical protein
LQPCFRARTQLTEIVVHGGGRRKEYTRDGYATVISGLATAGRGESEAGTGETPIAIRAKSQSQFRPDDQVQLSLRTRRMINRKLQLRAWVAVALLIAGCDNGNPMSKITRANYDQIHDKSSKEEVQAILGPPTSTNTEDKIIYKRTTWRYTEGDKYINLTFKNDELDSKDTNLGTK